MGEKAERRQADRKNLTTIKVSEITSISNYGLIAHQGSIVDVSTTGFLLHMDRKQMAIDDLRTTLNFDSLVGEVLLMFLPDMNLDLDGEVIRTEHIGKGQFEVAIQFSKDVPEYWRECLIDLLPAPGEL